MDIITLNPIKQEQVSKNVNVKSKKNKQSCNIVDKSKLWNIFDCEVLKKTGPIECVFRQDANMDICTTCNGNTLAFSDEGFLICTNTKCCTIYTDILDQTPEWRYYGADDNQHADPTRCGMPINPLLIESSFGCKVLCLGSTSYEMRKIKRYTDWQSMPYKEKSRYNEFQRITIMAQNSGIPKIIIDDAIIYHKKISDFDQTFRGDNKDGLIASSIYIACKINNYPRTAKEIATIFNLDVTSATQGCKTALTILNHLEKDMNNEDKTILCKTKPEDFIERFCSRLNINHELTQLCRFVAIKIEQLNLMAENTPHSIAAGIIYFVSQLCNINICKKDVKTISEISEVTINKCCKYLDKRVQQLIPKIILDKYKCNYSAL